MTPEELIQRIKNHPEEIDFSDVIHTIDENYLYTPTQFINGSDANKVINEAGTNEGSCKIFAFAQIHQLNQQQTLACFGHYYREDVLENPHATDHANIRNFIISGWEGIQFQSLALKAKLK